MRTLFTGLRTWRERGGVRLWLYLPFVFLSYAALDLALRFQYRALGMLGFAHPAAHSLTLGWCLLLTGIACLLPGRVKKGYLIVSVLFFAALTATHSILRNLFGRFFLFSTLAYAQDGFAFAEAQYIRIAPLVLLGIVLSLAFLALALLLAPGRKEQKPLAPAVTGVLTAGLGVVLILFCQRVWLTPDNTLAWDNFANPASVYENFTDSTATLLMAGLYQYTARDLALSLHLGDGISPEEAKELEAYAAKRQAAALPDNDYTGLFAGKNLILIQLEAIDTWMLSETYMPNLWALKQESMVFQNHYSPAYITAGTLNTEFMVNTGLLPATGNVSTKVYQRNQYPFALANQFRALGYRTDSFHGSEGNVYSRGSFHPAIGYERYHGGSDIGMADYTMDRDLLTAYDDIVGDAPFLSFLITYSGHGPYHPGNGAYIAHEEQAWALSPEGERDNYIYAVAGAMETDRFVGELLDRLEQDGTLEDTVLAFYADHYNYYMMNDEKLMAIKGVDDLNLLAHTDFFIYAKDRAPETVTKVTSSPDVLPTLANLFGLPDEGAVYTGNDAFSEHGGYVFFSDSSWLDGETYWRHGSPLTPLSSARAKEIAETMRMSNLLLQSDYYGE